MVRLAYPVEVDDLTVPIAQHFHLRRLLTEENLCPARERFYVGRVLRKYFNDPLCQSVLPTYV